MEEARVCRLRQSNFELLRIISMILIVAHHYVVHGGFALWEKSFSFQLFFLQALSYGGKLGVNLFVLISGYFLVKSRCKIRKIVKLWLQVTAFSAGITLLFWASGIFSISPKDLFQSFFPIIYNSYWFATAYFVIYLLSNYTNKLIEAIDRKEMFQLICMLTILLSVLPTFLKSTIPTGDIFWFFLLYLIGAYIRLYEPTWLNGKHTLAYGVGAYGFCLLFCLAADELGIRWPVFSQYATYFSDMQKTTMLVSSVLLFAGFKNLSIRFSPFINTVAASTFGIYLIHDNQYMRWFLWDRLFKNANFYDSPFLVLHAFGAISITFLVCLLADLAYRKLIEENFWKCVDWWLDKRDIRYKRLTLSRDHSR